MPYRNAQDSSMFSQSVWRYSYLRILSLPGAPAYPIFFFPLWKSSVVAICCFCLPHSLPLLSHPILLTKPLFFSFGNFPSSIYGLHRLLHNSHLLQQNAKGHVTHTGQSDFSIAVDTKCFRHRHNTEEIRSPFLNINIDYWRKKVFIYL